MSLPTDDKERKALPIWDGVIMYFPDVWAEVAKVSKAGNDQHNPGQPLHWARGKSTDQMNTAFRHMLDRGNGVHFNEMGNGTKVRHLAQAIWRLAAQLQLDIEADAARDAETFECVVQYVGETVANEDRWKNPASPCLYCRDGSGCSGPVGATWCVCTMCSRPRPRKS